MERFPAAGCKKCVHSEAGKMERENAQRENATRQRVLVVNTLQRVPAAGKRNTLGGFFVVNSSAGKSERENAQRVPAIDKNRPPVHSEAFSRGVFPRRENAAESNYLILPATRRAGSPQKY
jgi:hypothetical protein